MMMATWRGTSDASGISRVELVNTLGVAWVAEVPRVGSRLTKIERTRLREASKPPARSDRHQVGLFGVKQLVDFGDVAIRESLDVYLGVPLVVLRDLLVL